LWNTRIDFSDSLLTGEVKNIEVTMNVCFSNLFSREEYYNHELLFQNFFTVVKALANQYRGGGIKSDGYHHYENPECELSKR